MQNLVRHNRPITRRTWLCSAGAAGIGAASLPLLSKAQDAGREQGANRIDSPDAALRALVDGNQRFTSGAPSAANRSVARLRELEAKQTPFASILACSDSRVPPEILFDQGFGDLFVARVAGNIATSEVIGSLEYGTRVLGSSVLMVLGHTACGAVSATMQMKEVPGQIGTLFPYIHPAAEDVADERSGEGEPAIAEVVKRNVRHQVAILRNASPVIAALARDGKLKVAGGIFHFNTGRVEVIDA